MNLFEGYAGQILPDSLKWMNEPDEWKLGENHSLTVSAPAGADFFIDPAGGHTRSSAPFLHSFINGDFVMSTRLTVEMKEQYDSGCLMVMADSQNWAKLCFEFFDAQPSIISVVTKNTSDDCVSTQIKGAQPYLRIARAGNCFAFHYSLDGEQWHLVRYFGMEAAEGIKAGVVAQFPAGEGCFVTFANLHITEQAAAGDIRQA